MKALAKSMAIVTVLGIFLTGCNGIGTSPSPVRQTPPPVNLEAASKITDFDRDGNGFIVEATKDSFTVTVKDLYVKISVPYTGKVTDDGIREGRAGEQLVARAGWIFEENGERKKGGGKSAPYVIKTNDTKVVYKFKVNPSESGKPVNIVMSNGSLGGKKSEWLCPPWTNKAYFAKEDHRHPKGIHMIFFQLEGDKIRWVVDQARAEGWTPSAEFHTARGEM